MSLSFILSNRPYDREKGEEGNKHLFEGSYENILLGVERWLSLTARLSMHDVRRWFVLE